MTDVNLLDGIALSKNIRDKLKAEIANTIGSDETTVETNDETTVETNVETNDFINRPHLVAVLVGDDGPSQVYVRKKGEACQEVGIKFTLCHMPTSVELLKKIEEINQDSTIHGCIVQLPLPKHIDEDVVIYALSPTKDVDGFHPTNIGNMVLNKPSFLPATPFGIKMLLDHYKIYTEGQHIVILGKSMIVGQPLMNMLSSETGARGTVTCCDRYTHNADQIIKMADILIVATGKHNLINHPDRVKDQVVIIDVGIHQIPDKTKKLGYHLEGDVNFKAVKDKCSYITPVPGGVGPMTVVSLLLNTWKAYQYQIVSQKYSDHEDTKF